MSDNTEEKVPEAKHKQRLERQAQALRENLLKRKTQLRERAGGEGHENSEPLQKKE